MTAAHRPDFGRLRRVVESHDTVVRLTPSEWHAVLESRSFLDHEDNRFEHPRRLCGAAVEIVPDDSYR